MSDPTLQARIERAIAATLGTFAAWLRGEGDEQTLWARIGGCLTPDFELVSPQGEHVDRAALLQSVRDSRGARQVEIRVEQVSVIWSSPPAVFVTYRERHAHADYETTRASTALLLEDAAAPGGFRWRHIQETWILPPPKRR